MKFNDKDLTEASFGQATLEGRLNHKRAHKSGTYIYKNSKKHLTFPFFFHYLNF